MEQSELEILKELTESSYHPDRLANQKADALHTYKITSASKVYIYTP